MNTRYKYQQANIEHYGCLKERAAIMRKNPTPAEQAFWNIVRNKQLGVRFLRQYIIADYIVDFICPERMLIIELDGGYHDEEFQQAWDIEREHWLERRNYCVIRFKNEEVLQTPDKVIDEIREYLAPRPLK